MREQLKSYVDLLFAGAPEAADMKQEILQNTLDRYDDLIARGKSPEAAYRLSISGIGDINEILGAHTEPTPSVSSGKPAVDPEKKNKRIAAIVFYILSPVPLFILSEYGQDTLGLCMTLILIAAATALLLLSRPDTAGKKENDPEILQDSPQNNLRKSVNTTLSAVTLAVYLLLSFYTQAWFITWLVFPISAAVKGLVGAIWDLKEANNHEN